MRRLLLFIVPLALGALFGCQSEKPTKDKPTNVVASVASKAPAAVKTTEAKTTSAPAALPSGTGPAATVNGVTVSRDVFNREFTQTMERYQKARHSVRPSLQERLKDNIVRRLVDMELIRQQAKKLAVEVGDKEREERWAQHRKRYGTDEAYKAFLERAGTTEADIRLKFDANLLREKVFSQVASSVTTDDADVRKFYDDNVKRYTEPEQVRARHILVRKPPKPTPPQLKKLQAKAKGILKKVKSSKKPFKDLAAEYSEDVTKNRGGDLGWFAKGRMVRPFEEAAWKLKNGQVSGLVETNYGFHIIKREDFRPSRTKPFKEVEPLIRRSLAARRRNQAIQTSMKEWRDEANIEIFIKGDPAIIKADIVGPAKRPGPGPGARPALKGLPNGGSPPPRPKPTTAD